MAEHDLAALRGAHCRYEFETRDVDATMSTMVDAPYVNHIPTMAGGVGHDELKRFYKYHFIGRNSDDVTTTLVCRTIGANTLVDEFIFRFTHISSVDWMLPEIPPTGKTNGITRICRRTLRSRADCENGRSVQRSA
jgi:carboxymethylenebutenolidase